MISFTHDQIIAYLHFIGGESEILRGFAKHLFGVTSRPVTERTFQSRRSPVALSCIYKQHAFCIQCRHPQNSLGFLPSTVLSPALCRSGAAANKLYYHLWTLRRPAYCRLLDWVPTHSPKISFYPCPPRQFPLNRENLFTTCWVLGTKLGVVLGILSQSWLENMVRILWACSVIQPTGENLWLQSFPAPFPPVLLIVRSCLQARRFAVAGCAKELWRGLFVNTAQQSLFRMTASYPGTHGPSQGDCKLCSSRVKQWRVMTKGRGQTVIAAWSEVWVCRLRLLGDWWDEGL